MGQGVVAWDVEVTNQNDELVASYDILTLVAKRALNPRAVNPFGRARERLLESPSFKRRRWHGPESSHRQVAALSGGASGAAHPQEVSEPAPLRHETSSYITLADVKAMVLAGQDFEVRDAKTGEDLTRSILLQIILEEETGGVPMFSSRCWRRSSASTATRCRA